MKKATEVKAKRPLARAAARSSLVPATKPTPAPIHPTREQWLSAAVTIFRPWFATLNLTLPPIVRVSVGFPSVRALSSNGRNIGECWPPEASRDGATHVFISPVLSDPLKVADVLLHELVHAAEEVASAKCGHRGEFVKAARALGLTGKMTQTVATPELVERLNGVMVELGVYPHTELDPKQSPRKKQGTRLIKAVCSSKACGYVIRTTRKWVEEVGLPTCACGGEFGVEGGVTSEDDDEGEDSE